MSLHTSGPRCAGDGLPFGFLALAMSRPSKASSAAFMRSFRTALFLALTTLSLGGAGCKGNCRILSEKLCQCAPSSTDRDACVRRAANEESRLTPSPEQEETCKALIAGCDCNNTGSLEGKRACGLAR